MTDCRKDLKTIAIYRDNKENRLNEKKGVVYGRIGVM
jgi:hypothetical protein